ncbi:MAG: hypothetical protein IIW01_06200 [Thermoguttaceae bacterium]|nr:hypothetical protein [Thermoguttaceae bacterium]
MRVSRLLLAVATPSTLLSAASFAFSASAPLAVFTDSATPPNAAVSELTPEQRALFAVPEDGLSVEIYQKRLADADAFLRDVRETVDAETFSTLNAEMLPVCVAALRNLADAPKLSDDERARYWGELVDRLTKANDYDALRALLLNEENEQNLISTRLRGLTSNEERAAEYRRSSFHFKRVKRVAAGYLDVCVAVAEERPFDAYEFVQIMGRTRAYLLHPDSEFKAPAPTPELFDVPAGQTVGFYQRRVLELLRVAPNAEQAKVAAAVKSIFRLLADADVSYQDARVYLAAYTERLSQDEAKQLLEEEKAKAVPDSRLVAALEPRAFGGNGSRRNVAQTPNPASQNAETPEPPLDESLFDVPDGETTEFYYKRSLALREHYQARTRSAGSLYASPGTEEARRFFDALTSLDKRLADDPTLSSPERRRYFDSFVDALTNARKLDALRSLFEEEKAARDTASSEFAAARVDAVEDAIYAVRFYQILADVRQLPKPSDATYPPASPTLTPELETALRTLETDILAKATAGEKRTLVGMSRPPFNNSGLSNRWAGYAVGFAHSLDLISPDEAKSFRKELYAVVSTLEAPEDREVAERLQRQIRVDDLPGSEFPVEGVLADGAEIDWASYRGKVVYFAVYNSAFLTSEKALKDHERFYNGKRFAQLRDQYADAGFAILLYDVATEPPKQGTAPNVFGVEPNAVLSRALTRGAKKDYADLSELYLSLAFTDAGFIVDVDGKVLDVRATPLDHRTPNKLETLLQERFPNVGDASKN